MLKWVRLLKVATVMQESLHPTDKNGFNQLFEFYENVSRLSSVAVAAAYLGKLDRSPLIQNKGGWVGGLSRSIPAQAISVDHGVIGIELSELMSGGPGKDGIPAIASPRFVSPEEAGRWLKFQEPVISLVVGGAARAYPLQILLWHEIVNDRIGGVPVAVTFCPLCYSAVAFDRRIEGSEYSFGVSGMLRNSDMIMYDRETESLWQQLFGEAIVGDLTGARLMPLPAQIISFRQFSAAYPNGRVLSRDTGYDRPYGRNPYVGYDDINQPSIGPGELSLQIGGTPAGSK